MYYIHVLARVYMHVLVHNRKICVQEVGGKGRGRGSLLMSLVAKRAKVEEEDVEDEDMEEGYVEEEYVQEEYVAEEEVERFQDLLECSTTY